jgi:hypothetical protein
MTIDVQEETNRHTIISVYLKTLVAGFSETLLPFIELHVATLQETLILVSSSDTFT